MIKFSKDEEALDKLVGDTFNMDGVIGYIAPIVAEFEYSPEDDDNIRMIDSIRVYCLFTPSNENSIMIRDMRDTDKRSKMILIERDKKRFLNELAQRL